MRLSKCKLNRTTLILWIVIAAIVAGSLIWLLWPRNKSADVTAEIWVNSTVVKSIYLPNAADETFSLAEFGPNVAIEVKDHKICVLESDCADHICMNAGWLSKEGDRAVCMPNKVTVVLTAGDTVAVSLD